MDAFVTEAGLAIQRMSLALGLGSALPLFVFGTVAASLLFVGMYYIATANARAQRRTANLLGDIDAVMARLNEGERLGKFGTYTWNFQHPNMSFWSDQMYELCGLLKRKHVPSPSAIFEAALPEDVARVTEVWNAAQQQPGAYAFTYRVRGLNEELRTLRVEGVTTFDAGMKPYSTAGVIRDVTREVEVDKAKSEFVSLASHQLKTPLTTVRWHAEGLLAGAAGALTPAQATYVKTIADANQRMITLVNELLSISRIELNTFSQQPEEIDIRVLVESVVEEQRQAAVERNQTLNVSIAEVPHIIADKTMARMVFQNLLSNAIKYTPPGGSVTCEVGIGGAQKEGIFVRVQDTGIGIPKGEQGRVFERLHRASNARALVADGTGLGLYVVKMIVEHAGGGITFDSVVGKGTTFYVTFPFDWRTPREASEKSGK